MSLRHLMGAAASVPHILLSANKVEHVAMGSPLARNNAFGVGSPSWNLSFPSGNLTSAEILAYLPHWLKSVDVVDRFITNGGKSYTIAAMINEFRNLPGDDNAVFRPNSAQIMMSYGMRRAGFGGWTVGTHHEFQRPNPHIDETNLNVETFRPPRSTHPKSAPPGQLARALRHNEEADPIEFKELAVHVKKHPSGSDALDLSRCVQHAILHPAETWYFPDDFEALVNKLGGPAHVSHSHLDRQIFARREDYVFRSPRKSTPRSKYTRTPTSNRNSSRKVVPQAYRVTGRSTTPTSGSPLKRMMTADDMARADGRRKSGRIASKPVRNLQDYDSDAATDNDVFESSHSGYNTPMRKRKFDRLAATPGTDTKDDDFLEDESEPDDEVSEAEIISEDESISPINAARSRAAARKAREVILNISTETQRNLENLVKRRKKELLLSWQKSLMLPPSKPIANIDPEIMTLARNFSPSQPTFLKPPVLSANRLRVDNSSVYVYAADGCTSIEQMWKSALSSTRFNGPRRAPPFRELHRLTDPPDYDVSDWAENIRWAKEQHRVFGSETWTEYDYHLEMITAHRRMLWASKHAIAWDV